MPAIETKLEMARRHVREAERHVDRQRRIVSELRERGQLSEIAVELLAEFEQTLSDHRASLARIESSG
ncbi:MAG: hypothetical protein ACTHLC_00940 [Rhizobiaceae bacterium]|jgi:hypothetical protein